MNFKKRKMQKNMAKIKSINIIYQINKGHKMYRKSIEINSKQTYSE